MVVTRSGKSTGKKIKFLDDGELPSDAEVVNVDTREGTREPEDVEEEDEDDSDSDEAPEEESTLKAKEELLVKQKEQAKLEKQLRDQEREKRKQRDLQFKQQQDAKRERIRQLAEAEELPDLLPEEVLESDDDDETPVGGKHKRAEDLEQEHAAMRKKMKLEKLRQLKAQRQSAVKKGPVHVQVQRFGSSKNRVPAAEASVLESKNSWLQRASLNKK